MSWYGGGPSIPRVMIESGMKKRLVVEVYPMTVRVCERRNAQKEELIRVSKAALGLDLLKKVSAKFYCAPHRALLWRLGEDGYLELQLQNNLQKNGIDEGSVLIFEEKLPSGEFEPSPPVWIRPKGKDINMMMR